MTRMDKIIMGLSSYDDVATKTSCMERRHFLTKKGTFESPI